MKTKKIRKKVAFFIPDLRIGGAEKVFVQIANEFCRHGYVVDVLLAQKNGQLIDLLDSRIHLRCFSVKPTKLKLLVSSVIGLMRYVRAEKPDALFSSVTGSNLVTSFVSMLRPFSSTRFVIREATSIHNHSKLYRALSRWFYPFADVVLAGSKGVSDDLKHNYRLKSRVIKHVRNPVDILQIKRLVQDGKSDNFDIENGVKLIVAIGRLTKAKDYPTLIKALKLVEQQVASKLLIVGDGEERQNLQRLIDELGLTHVVHLMGSRVNPYPILSQADVMVLSSRWEGFPNVILEALSLNRKVVATDCHAGPREILEDLSGCFLSAVGDEEQLAECIVAAFAAELDSGEAAKRVSRYALPEVFKEYESLVHGL